MSCIYFGNIATAAFNFLQRGTKLCHVSPCETARPSRKKAAMADLGPSPFITEIPTPSIQNKTLLGDRLIRDVSKLKWAHEDERNTPTAVIIIIIIRGNYIYLYIIYKYILYIYNHYNKRKFGHRQGQREGVWSYKEKMAVWEPRGESWDSPFPQSLRRNLPSQELDLQIPASGIVRK